MEETGKIGQCFETYYFLFYYFGKWLKTVYYEDPGSCSVVQLFLVVEGQTALLEDLKYIVYKIYFRNDWNINNSKNLIFYELLFLTCTVKILNSLRQKHSPHKHFQPGFKLEELHHAEVMENRNIQILEISNFKN